MRDESRQVCKLYLHLHQTLPLLLDRGGPRGAKKEMSAPTRKKAKYVRQAQSHTALHCMIIYPSLETRITSR
jgi:hypothetical protein